MARRGGRPTLAAASRTMPQHGPDFSRPAHRHIRNDVQGEHFAMVAGKRALHLGENSSAS